MMVAGAQFPLSVCAVQDPSQEVVPPTIGRPSQFNEHNSPTSMPRGPSLGGSRFCQVESLHKSFQPVMSPPLLYLKTCREGLTVDTHENCVSMSIDTRLQVCAYMGVNCAWVQMYACAHICS